MATGKDFQECWEQFNLKGPGFAERFPLKEDRRAFFKWAAKKRRAMAEQQYIPISRADLVNAIDTSNYNNQLQRARIVSMIHTKNVPWLYAGTNSQGDIYRIIPQPYALVADQPLPKTGYEIISPNVLGVNLNVQPSQPSHRRIGHYAEESTMSNESDDPQETGFVFHQIGALELFYPAGENEEGDFCEDDSSPTNFAVVVRIGRNGAPAGIYIIYDFYSFDSNCESRPLKRYDDPYWGYLDGVSGPVAVAKIADTLSELDISSLFSPAIIADYPIELVRAVVNAQGTLQRVSLNTKRPHDVIDLIFSHVFVEKWSISVIEKLVSDFEDKVGIVISSRPVTHIYPH
ncbi:hypothetical protein FQN57_006613 [Myotisia sp. PD_48]|nr:hypothetical protein FQN57_006613 [Myotisia sp. PD_48]